jgi:uncharacterized damage-inducible protein DinB
LLDWNHAHVDFDAAVKDIPPKLRGVQPDGSPYSLWQLLEHIRIAQHDILDFCRNPSYAEKKWPDDYWPKSPAPPSEAAWDESLAAFRRDRTELKQLVADPKLDLFAKIPHGTGQTYLREAFLVADHNAYHIGQLVSLRRQLGIWPS